MKLQHIYLSALKTLELGWYPILYGGGGTVDKPYAFGVGDLGSIPIATSVCP